jgi:hypothetical protein
VHHWTSGAYGLQGRILLWWGVFQPVQKNTVYFGDKSVENTCKRHCVIFAFERTTRTLALIGSDIFFLDNIVED